MIKNMGSADSAIRMIIAAIIIILYAVHILSGTLAIILLILAGIFVLTSLMSSCPLYLPFGINTIRKKKK